MNSAGTKPKLILRRLLFTTTTCDKGSLHNQVYNQENFILHYSCANVICMEVFV